MERRREDGVGGTREERDKMVKNGWRREDGVGRRGER